MEKVLEFIIKAKDATAQAFNSAKSKAHSCAESVKTGFEKHCPKAYKAISEMAGSVSNVFKRIVESAKKAAKGISDAIARGSKDASSSQESLLKTIGKNLANVQAGIKMFASVCTKTFGIIKDVVSTAFSFERAEREMQVLLGSVEDAKEHVSALRKMGAETPLSFEDLRKASKLLLSFGSDVGDVLPTLQMLGDIAMGNSSKFQGLALVFAQVKSQGKLMGQDLIQMINQGFNPLTIIAQETGASIDELKERMSEGRISFDMVAEAMRVATGDGGRFNNAMSELSDTGEGMVSTLKDNWTIAVAKFGEAFTDIAKGGLKRMIDLLDQISKDGSIEIWADRVKEALSGIGDTMSAMGKGFKAIWDWSGASDVYHTVGGLGAGIAGFTGTLAYGGGIRAAWGEGWQSARDEFGKGNYQGRLNRLMGNKTRIDVQNEEQTEYEQNIRKAARKRLQEKKSADKEAEEKAAKQAKEEAAKRLTLSEMLAEDEARATAEAEEKERIKLEEKKKKEAERAAEKAKRDAEKLYQQQLKQLEALEKERIAAEERVYRKQVDDARSLYNESSQSLSDVSTRLERAQAKVEEAWGFYLDPERMQGRIDEAKKRQDAEKTYEKDFERLRVKYGQAGWKDVNITELSAKEAAVQQLALAKEEEKNARRDLKEIAENTKELADKLDELLTAKEGEA